MKIKRFLAVAAVAIVPALVVAFTLAGSALGGNGAVLILGPSVIGSPSSPELAAAAAGRTVTVVDATTWGGMTTDQFAAYDAIVIDDGMCGSADQSAALANVGTWSAAVTGNVYATTQDATYHLENGSNEAGAQATLTAAINYALGDSSHTGAFLSISCGQDVALLNSLSTSGSFVKSNGGSGDDVHIVTAPAPTQLAGLTDGEMSNWNAAWHTAFGAYPSDFTAFAVALDGSGDAVAVIRGLASGGARAGYCAVAGNTTPAGAAIAPGTFLDLAAGQPASDSHYTGALTAYFYEGLGISCDLLPGFTKTGEMVGSGGSGDPGGYVFMKKN